MRIYFVLENLDKITHLRFNFDACPVHSPDLSARALFCLNSLANVNTQSLIYDCKIQDYIKKNKYQTVFNFARLFQPISPSTLDGLFYIPVR